MTITLPTRLAPIALAALLCAPAAAFAQATSPSPAPSMPPAATAPGAPAPGAAAPGPQGAMSGDEKGSAAERVEQRIKQLQTELHITPAQDQEWKKFADVMRANARDMDAVLEQREHQFQTMNAVQNLRSYEQLAEKHAQHLKRLVSAFDTLYGKLTPEQKKLADNEFRSRAQARAEQREQHMQSGSSTAPHGAGSPAMPPKR